MKMDILGYKCKKCGHLHYPGRTLCQKCAFNEFDAFPMPTRGKLLTYTHLFTLPADFTVTNINLGIIELENGQRITGQLKIDNPKMGMKVKGKVDIVRNDDYNDYYGMVFYRNK